jgi:predicted nuclease with RNAse H fold
MLCGISFGESGENAAVAFISEETESVSVESNKEILDLVKDKTPQIVAVDTGLEERRSLSESEEKLQEEGFIFTPAKDDVRTVRRFLSLKGSVSQNIPGDEIPEYIRFNPVITGRELAIDSDEGLEGYGIDSSGIESAQEFDAVLGAVTARFYQQGQVREMAVSVPEPVKEQDEEEEVKKDPREGQSKKIPEEDDARQHHS